MENKIWEKYGIYISFFIILSVQLLVLVYWGNKKTNYYIDELYSMEYANYITTDVTSKCRITDTDYWKANEWVQISDYKAFITVDSEEGVFKLNLFENLKRLIKRRIYFWFLNAFMSLVAPGEVNKWSGLVLNYLVFIIFQITLFLFLRDITKEDIIALLGCSFYGFSALSIGQAEYIRFYSLTILIFLVVIICHYNMWKLPSFKKFILIELAGLFAAYLGLANSELILICCGGLFGTFFVGLLIQKKWKYALAYIAPMLAGAIPYLLIKTNLLDVIFNPQKYTSDTGARGATTSRLLNITFGKFYLMMKVYCMKIAMYLFNSIILMVISAVVLLVLIILTLRKSGLKYKIIEDGFLVILLVDFAIYTLFCGLTQMDETRYYSFAMFLFFLIITLVLAWCNRELNFLAGLRIIPIAMLIIACAVVPFKTRNVEYIYEKDSAVLEKLQKYSQCDILMLPHENKLDFIHSLYESVNLSSEEAKMYSPKDLSSLPENSELTDCFLIWSVDENSVKQLDKWASSNGYTLNSLGNTDASVIYVCEKVK